MKDIITKKHKRHLWKDEIGDTFLLTKSGEIYKYSDTVIRALCWSPYRSKQLKEIDEVELVDSTGDGLRLFEAPVGMLDRMLDAMGINATQRLHHNGKVVRIAKQRLGHAIIPYRPELPETREGGLESL